MHIYDCYRLLGLPRNASSDDIKTAYRRLARKYHPDMNANDPVMVEKFREVQEAYRILKELADQPATKTAYQEEQKMRVQVVEMHPTPARDPNPKVSVKPPTPPNPKYAASKQPTPKPAPDPDEKLKLDLLKRVKELLMQKKIVATIPIVDALRARYPSAPEVIHWQAIAYYRWGSELLIQGRLKEAEVYLKKVLTTDPSNRELCFEAKRDLERIARSDN